MIENNKIPARKQPRIVTHRLNLLAMSLAAAFGVTSTHAAGIVTTGQTATNLQVNGNVTNITTGTISGATGVNAFKTFNVDAAQTVNLILPNQTRNLVNLVYDQAINIQGTVNSLKNGHIGGNVVFADPYGMVVGSSGVLNAGSLTAVTPSAQFMNSVIDGDGKVNGTAVQQLLKGNVESSADGVIRIDGVINAAKRIRLQASGVAVGGTLNAGPDATHQAAFLASVNTEHLKQASGMVERDGEIDIVGGQSATISGTLNASGSTPAGGVGGKINVAADTVHLTSTARVNANGAAGGGKINIGVAKQGGKKTVAASTIVDQGAQLRADALSQGDGGRIVVYGETRNIAGGSYSARGGAQGGNGGLVEVSGKSGLQISAQVDTRAPHGQTGTLLIDPTNLDIIDGASTDGGALTASGSSQIQVGYLQSLGDTNITLQAANTLTVGDSGTGAAAHVDLIQTLLTANTGDASHPGNTLTLEAEHIVLNTGSQILTGGGNVSLQASGADASILVNAGATIDTITAATAAGRAAGDITLAATSTVTNSGGIASVVGASATVDVYGMLRGANVALTATANASNTNGDSSLTGAYNNLQTVNNADAGAYEVPSNLIFNGAGVGMMVSQATATVEVHNGASIAASSNLTLAAQSTQNTNLSYSVGGQDVNGQEDSNVPTALVYGGLAGGAYALIDAGANIAVGKDLNVLAADESTLSVSASTRSDGGKAGITAVIGYAALDAQARIAQGATITANAASNVNVAAQNDGSYSLSASSNSGGNADAVAGIAVAVANINANVDASLGATIDNANDVVVQAVNHVSKNTVSASTSVSTSKNPSSNSEAVLSGLDNTSLLGFLSGLLGSVSGDAESAAGQAASGSDTPFKLGGALALGMDSFNATATLDAGTTITAQGNLAVFANTTDAGLSQSASSGVSSATSAASGNPSAEGTLSAGLALGFYTHGAQAVIGPDSDITAAHVAVASGVDVPFNISDSLLDGVDWSKTSDLGSLLKIVTNPKSIMSGYANATGAASEAALSGAVNYLSLSDASTAWIGQNTRITTTGSSDSFSVTQVDPANYDPAPDTPTLLNFDKAVSVLATNAAQTITDAGNMAGLLGIPINPAGATSSGNVAVGGSADVVSYRNDTLAGVDDGVVITTQAGTGVLVNADSADFSIAIAPSGGSGSPIGVNGTAGVTLYDNSTRAIVSNQAVIDTNSLDVTAGEHLSTFTIGGALVSSDQAAVGVGVAVNILTADTTAGIGGIDAAWRPDGMTSTNPITAAGAITAGDVTVNAISDGQAYALSVAGTKSSSADTPDPTPDSGSSGSNSPSLLSTLMADATTLGNLVGGKAKSAMSTANQVAPVLDAIGKKLSSSPSAAPKESTPASQPDSVFGLSASGSVSVNSMTLGASATIDDAGITSNQGAVAVRAQNNTNLVSVSGSAALTTAGGAGQSNSATIAGAVAVEIENNAANAAISGGSITGANNVAVQALSAGEHLGIGIGAGVNTKNSGANVNVAGSVSLALLQNQTRASIDSGAVIQTANGGDAINVLAYDTTQTGVGGGALALGGSTGIGLALTYVDSASTVNAQVADATVSGFNTLSVLALDPTLIMAGALEASANQSESGTAGGGSFVINAIANTVTASIADSAISVNGAVQVIATDDPSSYGLTPAALANNAITANGQAVFDFNQALLAGQSAPTGAAIYGVAGGVNVGAKAVGIAYVDNEISNVHTAAISGTQAIDANTVQVQASDDAMILGIAAGVGVSTEEGGFAGVGSITVNTLRNQANALLDDASGALLVNAGGGVIVSASNDSAIWSLAGSVAAALAESPTVGLAISYDDIANQTTAHIDGAQVNAGANLVTVQASNTASIYDAAVSVAATDGALALAGSFAINGINDTTSALVDDNAAITGNLNVLAGNADGSRDASIVTLAGGVAVSLDGNAAGAGVGINTISSHYAAGVNGATVNLPDNGALLVSAQDDASIYTAALGGAVGNDVAAGVSLTVNEISTNISAGTANATIDGAGSSAGLGATETVIASSGAQISSLAGGIGVSFEGAAIGVASAVNRIDAQVQASVLGGAAHVGNLLVQADSAGEINSLAVGAAISTGQASVAGSIAVNLIGSDVSAEIGNGAKVSSYSDAGVLAYDDDTIRSLAGTASVAVNADANFAGGASIAVNQIGGNVQALIDGATVDALGNGGGLILRDGSTSGALAALDPDNIPAYTAPTAGNNTMSGYLTPGAVNTTQTAHGVVVDADTNRGLSSVAVTGSVAVNPDILDPSIALAATATVNEIGGSTTASIDNASLINQGNGTANANQSVLAQANSHAQAQSIVVSMAAAVWGGAGAAIDTEANTLVTQASIGGGSQVNAQNAVIANANSVFDVNATAAGLAAGGVGVTGTGEMASFAGSTEAAIDAATVMAGAVTVQAGSQNTLQLATGGIAAGAALGASGSYAVVDSTQNTEARISNGAAIQADGDVLVQAQSTTNSNLYAVSGAISGNTGIGIAAGVALIENITNALIEGGSTVTAGGAVELDAADTGALTLDAGGLGVGYTGMGMGATAAVSIVRGNVLAQIDASQVSGASVGLTANNDQQIEHNVVAVGAGSSAGLAGTVSVIMLGTGNDSSDNTGDAQTLLDKVGQFAASGKTGSTNGALTASEESSIASGAQSGNLGSGVLASGPANSAHAYITGAATVVSTDGDVTLDAVTSAATQDHVGALAAGGVGVGLGVGVTRIYNDAGAVIAAQAAVDSAGAIDVLAAAQDGAAGHAIDDLIASGSAGLASVTVNVGDEHISNHVAALVDGAASAATAISVQALDTSSIHATNIAGSIGALGVGAVVLDAAKNGSVYAGLNSGNAPAFVISAPDITVGAAESGAVVTATYAVQGGLLAAVGGNSAQSADNQNVSAIIGGNSLIDSTGAVIVQATRTPEVSASGFGVGVAGAVQAGVSLAQATVSGGTVAQVGDNVIFGGIAYVSVPAGTVGAIALMDANNNITGYGIAQFATLDVLAQNLVSGAGYSASASAQASGGGVLVGLNGSYAAADNETSVTAAIGDNVVLPMNSVNITADENSSQIANASGYSVAGLISVGVDIASASSNTATLAQLGSGAMSAGFTGGTLGASSYFLIPRGGDLSIIASGGSLTADGAYSGGDKNRAYATAGAGGALAAGAAAVASTQNSGSTTAQMLSGAATQNAYMTAQDGVIHFHDPASDALSSGLNPLETGSYTLSASHISDFFSQADSTAAAIVGASGATANGAVAFDVYANQGGNTAVDADNIAITAMNIVREYDSGDNAKGVSGGAVAAAGVASGNTIDVSSNVNVGENALLTVAGDPLADDHGRFSLIAANDIYALDSARATSGAAIPGLHSESATVVNAAANVNIGDGVWITSAGDMDIGTYNLATVENDAYGNAYGLVGGADGSAATTIVSSQNLAIGNNAELFSYGNMSIATGRGDRGMTGTSLNATADNQIYFSGAFGGTNPSGQASIDNSGTLTLGGGTQLLSVRDILLGTLAGAVNAQATGKGDFTIAGIPGTINDAKTSKTGSLSMAMNGAATAGVMHNVYLTIDSTGNVANASNGLAYRFDTYDPVGELAAHIQALQTILDNTDPKDTQTQQELKVQISTLGVLQTQLQGRGFVQGQAVTAIELNDILAAGGNIEINTGSYSGSGSLTAYGGPTVTISNASMDLLLVNNVFIPNELGGNIQFTGAGKAGSAYINSVNANLPGSISIANTVLDPVNQAPAIFLLGDIENLGGSLKIVNQSGDFIQYGTILSNALDISVPNGAYIINAPGSAIYLSGNPSYNIYMAPGGQAYTLGPTASGGLDSAGGFALPGTPEDPEEAVTYAANYLYNTGAVGSTANAADCNGQLGCLLSGNPQSSGQGYGWMFFYPGNAVNTPSPSDYIANYGPDTKFYGNYRYPSVASRTTTQNMTTVSGPTNLLGNNSITVGSVVAINADIVDINGTMNVGKPTDYSVTILDNPLTQSFLTCVADAACAQATLSGYRTADGLYALPYGYVVGSTSGNVETYDAGTTGIQVYYDPVAKDLVLGSVSGGGGAIVQIAGKIINTVAGGGNIVVNDGYAHVTVNNQTDLTLVTQNINTASATQGVIEITDKLKTDSAGNWLTTWYVYTAGQDVKAYNAYGVTDLNGYQGLTPLTGSAASYDPLAGERYTWTYTARLSRDFTAAQSIDGDVDTVYNPDGSSRSTNWQNATVDPWKWDDSWFNPNDSGVLGNWKLTSTGLTNDPSLENVMLRESITANLLEDYAVLAQYSALGSKMTWEWYVPTKLQINATGSAKADNSIGISFSGNNTSGQVNVNSNGSVIVGGNIYNPTGATSITVTGSGASITAGTDGIINTQSLTLAAQGGIGSVAAPLQVNLMSPDGSINNGKNTLSAVTGTGDIALRLLGPNDALITQIQTDAQSDVTLLADASLLNAAASGQNVITGRNITLSSNNGGIGAAARPMILDTLSTVNSNGASYGGVVNAAAFGGIYLEETQGDMAVGSVASTGDDVWLKADNGNIIDGSGIDLSDRTAQQASVWSKLGLLDTRGGADQGDITKSAAYAAVVLPYQNGIDAEYASYWNLMALGAVSADGKTFTLSTDGAARLQAQADAAGQSVAVYAQARFDTLTADLNAALSSSDSAPAYASWQAAYDSAFSFTASAAQIDAMTSGQYWTPDALLYAVNVAGLQPVNTAVTSVPYVNVAGANVTLIAGSGSIGTLGDAVSFNASGGVLSNLTDEQKAALLKANSSGDIINQVYTRNGVVDASCSVGDSGCILVSFDIKQNNPLYVSVLGTTGSNGVAGYGTGLSAAASQDVFLQAQGALPIVSIAAGRDAQITSESGMMNTNAGYDAYGNPAGIAITTGNNLVLENGQNDIGSNTSLMSLSVGGVLESARSGGDLYLSVPTGNLSFLNLVAGDMIWLTSLDGTAGNGNYYGVNTFGGNSAASLSANYLSLHLAGSLYGLGDGQALRVDLGSGAAAGMVSGRTNGNLFLVNDQDLILGRDTAYGNLAGSEILKVGGNLNIENDGALRFANVAITVGGDMTLDAASITMNGGASGGVITGGAADWTARSGDIALSYLESGSAVSNSTVNLAAAGGIFGINGAAASAANGGENLHATGAVTLDAHNDIGSSADRLGVNAPRIDADSSNGSIYLNLPDRGATAASLLAATANQSIDIVSTAGSGLLYSNLNAVNGGITVSASGNIVAASGGNGITAAQNVTLHTDGGIDSTASVIAAGQDMTLHAGGAIAGGAVSAGGAADIGAGGDVTLALVQSHDLQASAGGALTISAAAIEGDGDLQAVHGMSLGDYQGAGQLTANTGGTLDATSIAAGTTATLQADDFVLSHVETGGDMTLTARTGDLEYASLQSGGVLSAAIAGDVKSGGAGEVSARQDIVMTAGGSLDAKQMNAGRDADLTVGGNINIGTVTAGRDANLQAGRDIAIDQLTTGCNASLTAGGAIAVGATKAGCNASMAAGGNVTLGTLIANGAFTVIANNFTAQSLTANTMNLSAPGALSLGNVWTRSLTTRGAALTANVHGMGSQAVQFDISGYANPYADTVALNVDAANGAQFNRLWTNYGNIDLNTGSVAILDGWIGHLLQLTTPYGSTLMNNDDPGMAASAAVQLYSANQHFVLEQSGVNFATSALVTRFDSTHRDQASDLGGYRPYGGIPLLNTSAQRLLESIVNLQTGAAMNGLDPIAPDPMPAPYAPAVHGEPGTVNIVGGL